MSDREVHVDALRRASEVGRRSRAAARWSAVLWMPVAVLMPLYLIGERSLTSGPAAIAVQWAPLVAIVLTVLIGLRQRVESRVARRLTMPVTAVYVGLTLVCMLAKWLVLPDGPSPALVVLGLLPAVPALYAAGRIAVDR